jgi:hypothetical protein
MYMIVVLGIVQLYALRHPDANTNAHVTYGVLAVVVLVVMTSVYKPNTLFYICYFLLHLSTILIVVNKLLSDRHIPYNGLGPPCIYFASSAQMLAAQTALTGTFCTSTVFGLAFS